MAAGLNITPQSKEKFMSSPYLENFLYGSRAVGTYSPESRRKEPEGDEFYDVDFAPVNNMNAIYLPNCKMDFAQGYNESFLAGDKPLMVVLDSFAEENGIGPGDELTFPVYTHDGGNGPQDHACPGGVAAQGVRGTGRKLLL